MAGRRFFQRGHASVPAASLSSGAGGVPRWLLAAAAATIASGAYYLFGARTESFDSMGSQVAQASPAPGLPSMLESALPTVQAAIPPERAALHSSGLKPQPLNDDSMAKVAPLLGQAEARLIAIYRLISEGLHREALAKAEQLVRDHPNFHLAHLVHGDLLSLQVRPVRQLGDVPDTKASSAAQQLAILRDESRRRLSALTERPPEGAVPSQFLSLSSSSRHAIAVDASRSRLYLFENLSPPAPADDRFAPLPQFKLLGDFYISVGLSGIEKSVEGDKRTPLGVYYITSNLNPSSLPDLYGVGALPINYPNPLDVQRGKTGSGIWLHGTPRDQFVRAPQASDGCVVLSNPDLEKLLDTVEIRTTPVVIAPSLQWVQPQALEDERQAFEATLLAWRDAKSVGQIDRLRQFYATSPAKGKDAALAPWSRVEAEFRNARAVRELELKDVSMLHWKDRDDTMVVTFGEVAMGQSRGVSRRQYWTRESGQWKIFSEGTP
jgi:L,D-transpeptidase YnhG